ncbi:MAG: SH3 domain-containing protein [Chloroflexi bacterium]|nr:SH3 domain-containing protein [Chloroflexota bacterium]
MYQDLYPRPRQSRTILIVVGWVIAIIVGVALIWYGFTSVVGNGRSEDATAVTNSPTPTQMAVWATATPLPPAPAASLIPPTDSPTSPTVAPEQPTAIPALPTVANASAVVGAQGVNVRSGPGTNFARLGYLDPGAQVELIGRYNDWWQIRYNGAPAWVFGELVTPSNADNVASVAPPPSPIPPTAAPPTAVPPTTVPPTEVPPADFRGLEAAGFQVEGAPGPYSAAHKIWFNIWINNTSSAIVEYDALGVFVEETSQYQKSYFSTPPHYPHFAAGQRFAHRDHINQFTLSPGTYHLWLMVCFTDGYCPKMLGPTEVIVQ